MRFSKKPLLFLCLLLTTSTLSTFSAAASRDEPPLRQFLDLYSRKDLAGVMNLLAESDILVMGSDLSEVCTTRPQVEDLLRNDFMLWDSSSFGALAAVFMQHSGNLVTAFFDAPFTLQRGGNKQTVTVRFATVWEKTSRGWRLVQSSNTTPTVGQSAKELLNPPH